LHTEHRKGGEAVFLEGVAVLTLLELEKDTRVLLVEGLVVLKRDLTTVSTTEEKHPFVEELSFVLEGEKEELSFVLEGVKEEGSGSIPARQTAGKTIGGRVLLRLNAKVCGFR